VWTLRIAPLVNVVAVFLAVNPWLDRWSGQAAALLVLEAILVAAIGVPAVLFQIFVRGKAFPEAVRASVEAVMDFVAGAA
jgi:hypothetical protein